LKTSDLTRSTRYDKYTYIHSHVHIRGSHDHQKSVIAGVVCYKRTSKMCTDCSKKSSSRGQI